MSEKSESLPSLESLSAKINQAKQPLIAENSKNDDSKYISYAIRFITDMIAGLLVGGILGYLFDLFLDLSPWGVVLGAILGLIAGIRNIMKSFTTIENKVEKMNSER